MRLQVALFRDPGNGAFASCKNEQDSLLQNADQYRPIRACGNLVCMEAVKQFSH
jgi:hypothetical protein